MGLSLAARVNFFFFGLFATHQSTLKSTWKIVTSDHKISKYLAINCYYWTQMEVQALGPDKHYSLTLRQYHEPFLSSFLLHLLFSSPHHHFISLVKEEKKKKRVYRRTTFVSEFNI